MKFLKYDELEDTLNDNDIVLIDFYTNWCAPCKIFAPVFEAASKKHTDVMFTKCDTEVEQQLATSFGIRSIPTLAVFREKILLFFQPGSLPADALEDIITQVKNLDMDDIRKKIEEENDKSQKD